MFASFIILLFGLLFCGVACNFFAKYRLCRANVQMIRDLETSNIADLRKIQLSVAEEIGRSNAWREQVELKGMVIAEHPLTAELSEIPCVYCHTVIEEQYERTEYETNDDGETEAKDVIDTKILSYRQDRINFYLEDKTDKILVNPQGAEIDGLTVVNEFESCDEPRYGDCRTLGYKRIEKIIELGSAVYVLGEIHNLDGRLQMGAPNDRQTPFIISYRSESELIKQRQSLGRGKLLWGIFILLNGVGLIVLAIGLFLVEVFGLGT